MYDRHKTIPIRKIRRNFWLYEYLFVKTVEINSLQNNVWSETSLKKDNLLQMGAELKQKSILRLKVDTQQKGLSTAFHFI